MVGKRGGKVCIRFFFFQAEDGIRDSSVTGVQTCALPISTSRPAGEKKRRAAGLEVAKNRVSVRYDPRLGGRAAGGEQVPALLHNGHEPVERSEERRVGKECRSRWSPDH